MLRFVALCFATALTAAFSEYSPELPDFGPVYSVRYDETDLLRGTKYPFELWYDETQNMSLLEHYGAQTLVGRPGANTGRGRWIMGYYVTTETYLNRWTCWNHSDTPFAFDYFFASQRVMPLDHRFNFIEKDIVQGQEADKWGFALPHKSKIFEFTTWVTAKLGGSPQAVPLRHEIRVFGYHTGEIHYHTIKDFYDFDTSAFDPEIFNIKRDAVNCTTFWPRPFEDRITTRLAQRGQLPRLRAARVEHHAYQQHLLPVGPETFRRHLRYREARGGAGRGAGTRPAALRPDSPPGPSQRSGALPFPYSDAEVAALSKDLPEQFDWRMYGAVTPVKDIDRRLVSYAFCATDLVALALYVQKNTTRLLRLSEQAIIDCSWEYNFGYHGYQRIPATFEWIHKHGLPTEVDYGEYQAENGFCRLADVKPAATIKGYVEVPHHNENALKLAIWKHGPVAVAIDDEHIFDNYNGGVHNDSSCSNEWWVMEYCLAVGWGVLDGQKYWIVKPSNSYRWGIGGYALIAVDNNICGVLNKPVFVVV